MSKDKQCNVCGLHNGIKKQLNTVWGFTLGIIAVVIVSVGVSAGAWNASNKAENKLDVYSAGQGQRMKNIDQSLERIEKLLEKE